MKLKAFLVAAFAALALTAQAKDYPYESVPGDPLHARIYTLANGLKVYLAVNTAEPNIQTYIAVRTGSRNDPAETTGLAHYLEHLMFKGTRQFGTSDYEKERPYLDDIERRYEAYRRLTDPEARRAAYHEIDSVSQLAARYNIPNEYDKLISSIGGTGSNAYTSNDQTVYQVAIPANEVEKWLRIESDRFRNMVIRGFHTELEAVYEEYNIGLASDFEKEYNALAAKLFPGHPYGTQTTIGTQEHLKNPSIVNIKNYFDRYYVPNNVAICLAGDLDPDKTVALIDKYFGTWQPSPSLSRPEYAPVRDLTAPTDTTVCGMEAENIMMGWKADGANSAQADTLEVISKMLSNGRAGLIDLDITQSMKCLWTNAGVLGSDDYSAYVLMGSPLEGQSLDDVKALLLAEIEKLKSGDFSDDLLPSVLNNMKLEYQTGIESNEYVADCFVDAFTNHKDWHSVATRFDRYAGITKEQLAGFARRFFRDNYAAVYKRRGEDTTLKKIEKPAITAIPTNRDMQSTFVSNILSTESAPIEPRFADFTTDLTHGKTKKGLPVLYVHNTTNDLFTLEYYYEFGTEADKWLPFATEYLDYLGTDRLTAAQVKQEYYKLACDVNIRVTNDRLYITVSGLSENMAAAMALTENYLANAKVDRDAYDKYVATVEKERRDAKLSQRRNYSALVQYAKFGPYNPMRNVPDSTELHQKDPQVLVDLVKGLSGYEHTVLYYGPATLDELIAVVGKQHTTPKHLAPVPAGRKYAQQPTPRNEIFLAPYEAKNVYMEMWHNEGRKFNIEQYPVIALFNEYFGSSMNSIVFQELRESRGLAYSASSYYGIPMRKSDTESASNSIISQNDKLTDCIRVFQSIIDTIPQSEKAFTLAKQSLRKQLASTRTTKMGIIRSYLFCQGIGSEQDTNKLLYEGIAKLTLQDIVGFERETMAGKPWRYIILGGEKELDIEALEKIGPVRRVSTEEIFGY